MSFIPLSLLTGWVSRGSKGYLESPHAQAMIFFFWASNQPVLVCCFKRTQRPGQNQDSYVVRHVLNLGASEFHHKLGNSNLMVKTQCKLLVHFTLSVSLTPSWSHTKCFNMWNSTVIIIKDMTNHCCFSLSYWCVLMTIDFDWTDSGGNSIGVYPLFQLIEGQIKLM